MYIYILIKLLYDQKENLNLFKNKINNMYKDMHYNWNEKKL